MDWGILSMKLSKYLSSKFYVIALALIVTLIEVTFFVASGNNIDTILFFTILLWVLIGCILFIDYYMKASFYKRLTEIFDKLDKKYLVHEMVKEPDFLEGKILYDILQDLDKNIHDSINEYAIREKEYKEYIELWVHEVKTPLAAAKLISENNKSSEMIKIEKELERIDGFVEQALFYARSTSVEKDYVLKEYKLTDIVNPIIRKHKETFIYKKIKVELNNLDTLVYTDEKWMIFIINQLIDNALKYVNENGIIQLSATVEKENTILYIKDNGIGITNKDVKRVFERGFTGDNGRQYSKSTGMGLYLCKRLCEKLYVGLELDSTQNEGTTVKLIFPLSSMIQLKGK